MEQWAELRREHFVACESIKELARSTGLSRNTIRRALRNDPPPSYQRVSRPSVLDPLKPEICRILKDNHAPPGVRVRELLEPLGCTGGLPKTLVWDRQAGIHAHGGRPTEAFAAFCGQLKVGWHFCAPADPQAKGVIERFQGYAETNFEPGRVFANELDFQDQLDAWSAKVNARTHKTLRARPVNRLAVEHEVMAPLPDRMPDTARRWVMRVPPDPHLRLDTNDYSLDPALVGRRVEVTADQRSVTAIALGTGELACRHARTFARHRTITALERARALRAGRQDVSAETPVEVRPLARYDQLIA